MKKGLLLTLMLGTLAYGASEWLQLSMPTSPTAQADNGEEKEKHRMPLQQRIEGAINYLNQMRINPQTGEIDNKAILKARQEAQQIVAEKDNENMLNWQFLGPNNVGGRTRVLWIDPNNSNHLIAGGVSGGLWVSNDAANNWQPHSQNADFVNVAANCITRGSDGTIYVGTGEFFAGYGYVGAGFPGHGILKSTDNGTTFQQVPSTIPGASNDPNQTWASVTEIAADPNENIIYAGTPDGIFVSVNGGDFVEPNGAPGTAGTLVYDMAMGANGLLHALIGSSYYQITHTGTGNDMTFTYTKKSGTEPGQLPSIATRRRLSVSAANPNYLYIVSVTGGGCLDRVYRSIDGGNIWEVIGTGTPGIFDPAANGTGSNTYCQGGYDLFIEASPADPDMIYLGGITVWRWRAIQGWEQVSNLFDTAENYVHADTHNMYFDPNHPNRGYVTSDGGITRTDNANADNVTFSAKNKNYNVTQFYSVSGNWEGAVMGGSQDNGVQRVAFNGQNSQLSALEVMGGDGGDVEFSQTNLNVLFAGTPSNTGEIGRSSNGGSSFGCFYDENINNVTTDGDCVMDGGGNWITPFYLWEDVPLYQSTQQRVSQFITGTATGKVWLTNEALNLATTPEWHLAGTIGGTPKTITAVAISKDGNYAVAASSAGRLMRISIAENDTDYVVLQIAATDIGGSGYITSVNFGNSSDVVVVSYGGYGGSDKVYLCTNFTTATTAAALDFVSVQANLPKFPVFSVIVDADNNNRLIAGTDLGVWLYDIAAQTWSPQIAGLGNVPILEVRQTTMRDLGCNVLYIGSYGRGFWRTTSLTAAGCDTELPVWSAVNPITSETFEMLVSPMPMTQQAIVQVSLPTSADKLNISVFDLQGKQVAQWQKNSQVAGVHQYEIERGNMTPGIYLVTINADGRQISKKIVVQ